jgi:hypothetical protein
MTWHPSLDAADAESAWFEPEQLAAQRADDEIRDRINRRNRFHAQLAELREAKIEVTDERRREAWELTHEFEASRPDEEDNR